jgi:hypothetical protein
MTKYEISAYICGVKVTRIVFAKNRAEAEQIAWELFDNDVYVTEVR